MCNRETTQFLDVLRYPLGWGCLQLHHFSLIGGHVQFLHVSSVFQTLYRSENSSEEYNARGVITEGKEALWLPPPRCPGVGLSLCRRFPFLLLCSSPPPPHVSKLTDALGHPLRARKLFFRFKFGWRQRRPPAFLISYINDIFNLYF